MEEWKALYLAATDLHADEVALQGRAGLRAGDKEAIWAVH